MDEEKNIVIHIKFPADARRVFDAMRRSLLQFKALVERPVQKETKK